MNWIHYLNRIPRKDFISKFSRSSGPGGQNVNKLNSKAIIKLEREKLMTAKWLEPEVRERILQAGFTYLTHSGDLLVSSDRTRSQQMNLDDCFTKLSKEIAKAAFTPSDPSEEAQSRWKHISKREKANKKNLKQRHASKKKDRKGLD